MAICIYGATGFTGKLVVDELVRRNCDFVCGARSIERLEALADERGLQVPLRAASTDDPRSLRALLSDCEVVINCAGPFSLVSEPVLSAACDTGTHYVDSTGEQAFMRLAFERYGPRAKRQGVCLVPAAGFDYLVGDCIARLTAAPCEPLSEIVVAYAVSGFGPSRGTLRSALQVLSTDELAYTGSDWRPAEPDLRPRSFEFAPPIGRTTVISYPSGEILTVPRHTDTQRVVSLMTASTVVPHRALLPLVAPARRLGRFAGAGWVRGLCDRLIDRVPEGPDSARRQAARFTVTARANGLDGSTGEGTVDGGDPYGLTAAALVRAATTMRQPDFAPRGALAPAEAFSAQRMLDDLAGVGVRWQTDHAGSAV